MVKRVVEYYLACRFSIAIKPKDSDQALPPHELGIRDIRWEGQDLVVTRGMVREPPRPDLVDELKDCGVTIRAYTPDRLYREWRVEYNCLLNRGFEFFDARDSNIACEAVCLVNARMVPTTEGFVQDPNAPRSMLLRSEGLVPNEGKYTNMLGKKMRIVFEDQETFLMTIPEADSPDGSTTLASITLRGGVPTLNVLYTAAKPEYLTLDAMGWFLHQASINLRAKESDLSKRARFYGALNVDSLLVMLGLDPGEVRQALDEALQRVGP